MALALYRKYRPRTFAEVVGQEHVTEPLIQALSSGRLHHAYLFSGPRGCGKTSSARILARSLNCEQGPTPDPCGECASCVALAPDGSGSIDVIEIDAASHGGVDDARELRERAFFAPVSSRYKVYVIDEAHMVSSAGFNALLKLVEEPPDFVKFVFATTEPEKVLGTIKSRTHHYPFRLIPPRVLRPLLERLCDSEGVKVEPAVFPLVVRAGGGSARDALSVLDQLIAGAGSEGVTYTRAVALLGVTDAALLDGMCEALTTSSGAGMYATINEVLEAGHDPRRFAGDLLERFRDLIVLQQVPDAATKGLLDYPEDQLERLVAQAGRIGTATLTRCAGIVHDGLTEMRGTTAPRLLLELMSARMLLPGAEESTAALLQRVERLERGLSSGQHAGHAGGPAPPTQPSPQAPTARPAPVPQPINESAGASAAAPHPPQAQQPQQKQQPQAHVHNPQNSSGAVPSVEAIGRVWNDVLMAVRRQSAPRIPAILREATVHDVDDDTLVLLFRHQVYADMLAGNPTRVLLEALAQFVRGVRQVRCEVAGQGPAAGAQGVTGGRGPARSGPNHERARQDRSEPMRGVGGNGTAQQPHNSSHGGSAHPREAVSTAPEAWPEIAVPGGAVPSVSTVPPAPRPPVRTAQPAAPAVSALPPPTPPRASGDQAQSVSAAESTVPSRPVSSTPPAGGPGSGGRFVSPSGVQGVAAARAAAASARSAASRGQSPGQRAGTNAGGPPWEDEPPFDPEYDSVPADPQFPGFDPGDEPLDDDQPTTRETSEEQAIRLLRECLGAERIA